MSTEFTQMRDETEGKIVPLLAELTGLDPAHIGFVIIAGNLNDTSTRRLDMRMFSNSGFDDVTYVLTMLMDKIKGDRPQLS